MEKLDVKDRKILYELDIDSRQSFSQLGKRVGLHKDVVAYRVKKLQEKGIIKNFVPILDNTRLGYHWYRFYFNYQYASPEIKEEIADYFVKAKYTHAVLALEGHFDLCVNTHAKDVAIAYSVWEDILKKYRDYFANQVFSVVSTSYAYRYLFLLEETGEKRPKNIKSMVCGSTKTVEIDDVDYNILNLLCQNARIPTLDISNKLNVTTTTVKNRIKKLIELDVIKGFRINLDFPLLGYRMYKCDIVLKDHNMIHQIIKYIDDNPNLEGVIRSIGYVDLELVFILNTGNQLHDIMKDLALRFPDSIKNYTYFSIIKTYKWADELSLIK
jgi:DNA-binding Lrp family transcriptional regulator